MIVNINELQCMLGRASTLLWDRPIRIVFHSRVATISYPEQCLCVGWHPSPRTGIALGTRLVWPEPLNDGSNLETRARNPLWRLARKSVHLDPVLRSTFINRHYCRQT
jgi:hypothetical protein